jgi:hypothetical protein
MDRYQAQEVIKTALISAIRDRSQEAFKKSQQKCPVITGELRSSGSEKDIENGAEIDYIKDYASFVERGVDPGTRNVKAHVRQGKPVKGYSYFSKGQKAQHFIESSMTESFDTFASVFDNSLKQEAAKYRGEVERL